MTELLSNGMADLNLIKSKNTKQTGGNDKVKILFRDLTGVLEVWQLYLWLSHYVFKSKLLAKAF